MAYLVKDIEQIAKDNDLDPEKLRAAFENAKGFSERAVGPGSVPEELCLGATLMAIKGYLK